eukprot:3657402-Amphidinium_carterae.1
MAFKRAECKDGTSEKQNALMAFTSIAMHSYSIPSIFVSSLCASSRAGAEIAFHIACDSFVTLVLS